MVIKEHQNHPRTMDANTHEKNGSKQASVPTGTSARYSLFPIQFPTLYAFYTKQRDAFWVPAEVDLSTDIEEWKSLTDNERVFLTHILAFFAQADGIVLQNVKDNFSVDTDIPEMNIFYGIQSGIEAIHWEMYSILIETLVKDVEQKQKALSAIEHYPCIRQKAQWMQRWMCNENPLVQRLLAFACAEGISFSSSFAGIFYFKKKGILPGLCLSNKFIARDEGLHRDFGLEAIKVLQKLYPDQTMDTETVHMIVKEAVEVERNFVYESLQVNLIGLSAESMYQYVCFVADHLVTTLGYPKIYNVENPFDWMTMISMTNKQNFFEGRVSEYKKASEHVEYNFEEDF